MAKRLSPPYGNEILTIEHRHNPITQAELLTALGSRVEAGVTLCVLPPGPKPHRGGYFFQFKREDDRYKFCTFNTEIAIRGTKRKEWKDGRVVFEGDLDEALTFINHACGLEYSEDGWAWSQEANLIRDEFMEDVESGFDEPDS